MSADLPPPGDNRGYPTLQVSREALECLLRTTVAGFWLGDTGGHILAVNPSYCRLSGYTEDELLGMTIPELDADESPADTAAHLEKLVRDGYLLFETRHRRKDGTVWDVEVSCSYLESDGGRFYAFFRDITERRRAEAALRRSERLLATSQHLARVGGWEWDIDRNQSYWTSEMFRIYDLEPGAADINAPGFIDSLRDRYDPADRPVISELFRRCRSDGDSFDREFALTTFAGRRIWIRTTAQAVREDGRVTRVVGNVMDITERRVAEREVLKVEKLESLGVLAGGIAHDFNNILTGVMGNLTLAQALLDSGNEAQRALSDAVKATARAEALALQLLTFARGGEPVKREIALRPLVEDTLSLTLRGTRVRGEIDVPDDVHGLYADPGQLAQAFQNIILNAVQAMPEGGELRVEAANEVRGEAAEGLAAGPYVRLRFADTGSGIAPEDLPRIFDPYFTTKQHGNGLGLASVYSIVNRHGGRVDVDSAPGRGAAFVLRLPSTGVAGPGADGQPPAAGAADALFTGRVLVMDDDDLVLRLAVAMMEYLGFAVDACCDGGEAARLHRAARQAGEPYRLTVMDLTVPGGMGGKEAAAAILAEDPAACLIVSSGYSNDPILSDYGSYGFAAAVAKPYSVQQLKHALREVLGVD